MFFEEKRLQLVSLPPLAPLEKVKAAEVLNNYQQTT